MANFAKSQLLKYGWTEGKGLGKNESGITEAIKPKLKFDNAGIGHDASEQFTYHWWENVFNKAANNISVDTDNDKVLMKVIDKDTVDITTKKSSLKALKKENKLQYNTFLKTSTLLNDGKIINENNEELESPDDLAHKLHQTQLTDEELFKACGGRTAHKGARHGLTLNGKLARIAEQEKELLMKMNLNKSEKVESSFNLCQEVEYINDFEIVKSRKRTKNKRKKIKTDSTSMKSLQDVVDDENPQPSCSYTINPDSEDNFDACTPKRKTKKHEKNNSESTNIIEKFESVVNLNAVEDYPTELGTGSNKFVVDDNANTIEQDRELMIPPITKEPKHCTKSKKSRKKEKRRINDLTEQLDTSCVIDESMNVSRKRKRVESEQIVEEILTTVIKKCDPSGRKCRKRNTEENVSHNVNETDRRNAKISKKKRYAHKKRQRDKLEHITKELMSVNLDNSEKEIRKKKKKRKHRLATNIC